MAEEDARYFSVMVAIPAAQRDLANRLFSELGEGNPFSIGLHRIGNDPAVATFYAALYARVRPGSDRFALLKLANAGTSPDLSLFAEDTTQEEVDQVFGAIRCFYTWQEPDGPDVNPREYFKARVAALGYASVQTEPSAEPVDIQAAAKAVREWLSADSGTNAKAVRNRAGAAMRDAILSAGGTLTNAQAKAGAEAFMVEAFKVSPDVFI